MYKEYIHLSKESKSEHLQVGKPQKIQSNNSPFLHDFLPSAFNVKLSLTSISTSPDPLNNSLILISR
jgi:hypothetical protein